MCRKVTCSICHRPSWAGCGAHVEQVLGDVPAAERCQGHAAPAEATGSRRRGLFSRKK
ncbi:MAG: hypothetical protein ACO277_03625 [Ilumatobacteraceae bacterium]